MTRWYGRILLLLVLVGVVGCDHTTKHLVTRHLDETAAVGVIPRVLELRRVENTDTAFGLLGGVLEPAQRRGLILALQGAVIAGILLLTVRRRHESRTAEHIASALLLGGAIGNFSDRWLRGYVVDFIHVPYWPVFNVADIALCAGIGLLVLAGRSRPVHA